MEQRVTAADLQAMKPAGRKIVGVVAWDYQIARIVDRAGDRSAAEDLAAETFEKAFRTWRRFDPVRSSPRTWAALCEARMTATRD